MIAFAAGIPQILIWLIVIAGCVGIFFIVVKASGIAIPGWAIQILWIVLLVVVAVMAIRFLMTL